MPLSSDANETIFLTTVSLQPKVYTTCLGGQCGALRCALQVAYPCTHALFYI